MMAKNVRTKTICGTCGISYRSKGDVLCPRCFPAVPSRPDPLTDAEVLARALRQNGDDQ